MVVYLDVLIFINLAMNIVLLYFVAMILSLKPHLFRIFAGGLAGSILLMEVFYPKAVFFQSLEFKLLVSIVMVTISFKPRNFRAFIKILGFFYLISFMLGGGVMAFFYLINMDKAITNSIFLFNSISLPWWILLVSSSLMLLFFKFIWPLLYTILSRDKMLVSVTVALGDKGASFPALIDTGNDLNDPISNDPVIIAEFDVIKDLFDKELQKILQSGAEGNFADIGDLTSLLPETFRIRLIPYESIGKSHGIMVGFVPDLVTVIFEGKVMQTRDVIIGVHRRQLASDDTYKALLNPGLLKG